MHGPPVVGWLLVLVCATAGAVCLARSRRGTGRPERRSARLETAMGFAMALMAVPGSPVPASVFVVAFVGVGLVAVLLWARTAPGPDRRHLPHHLIEAGAMAAMAMGALGPAAGSAGHTGHGGGAHPAGVGLPAALLACYFLACALRRVASLAAVPSPAAVALPTAAPARPAGLAALPETAHACRAALALATATMLLL